MRTAGISAIVYHGDSRRMADLESSSVELIVTSPPYWQIKDYGVPGQIGHGQGLHAYLRDLSLVWGECHRVIREGGRMCVNIGDQFARASLYGRYRVIPLHAEVICQCAAHGFDFMGSIIWRKKTTMNTSGGATVMGSYPHPPNGIVEIDFEFILLFKKPGTLKKKDAELKKNAAMSRDEWKTWFSGHWELGGARKKGHEAPFPEEIPRRLIRMFSFPGDTVLDPFLGTGTTAAVAQSLGRNAIGYEISEEFTGLAMERLGPGAVCREARRARSLLARGALLARGSWVPRLPDLVLAEVGTAPAPGPTLHSVVSVAQDCSLMLDSGLRVVFLDIRVSDPSAALSYLTQRVLKKKVFLMDAQPAGESTVRARVLLKNRISISAQLVKAGAAARTAGKGR
ncbi:MAG TPA: site-specific DNA-methyltransferase [Spirochaetia bacterium]|nr:site-specific DNA-methyltransferase [Spirochaetia bacterium]